MGNVRRLGLLAGKRYPDSALGTVAQVPGTRPLLGKSQEVA